MNRVTEKAKQFVGGAAAAPIHHDGIIYSAVSDGLKVVGVSSEASEIQIPAEVGGQLVTTIGRAAFRGNMHVQTVVLPATVHLVGRQAFQDCLELTYVELPSDLEVINASVFEGCKNLETVCLPYELKRIASRAFAGCTALKNLPHFVKTGISTVMTVDRSIVEENLPTNLTYIGKEAFQGCEGLVKVVIPYRVNSIRESVFEGCINLNSVWLHSFLREIASKAFSGCTSLSRVRVPSSVNKFGNGCFDIATALISAEGSPAQEYAASAHLRFGSGSLPNMDMTSMYGATGELSVNEVLQSPELVEAYSDRFELRPPTETIRRKSTEPEHEPISRSRFELRQGTYESIENSEATGDVTVFMVGDLMSRHRQQETALRDEQFDFSASFDEVRQVLHTADLTIGNMETMVSKSFPYMHERMYVDDRPHLNAPTAYLEAVRGAGFDVVVNAQNHMYDAGVLGVLETLDSLNKAELIHSGMYMSPSEQRFLLFEIKGMKIGLVSYLDGARQKMKQANFTEEGLEVISSHFDVERVNRDISAAKSAGAEFIIAYCHWGREYTSEITVRQEGFAKMVADAGADYLFGSHSHCPQPYTRIMSSDGRVVPVVYSGGNFLSDIGLKKPITQDTFVASLKLTRNSEGRVVVKGDGYLPCRIIEDRNLRGYVKVVPCETLTEVVPNYDALKVDQDRHRISGALGLQYSELTIQGMVSPETEAVPKDGKEHHALKNPVLVQQISRSREHENEAFLYDEDSLTWRKRSNNNTSEAVLMCAGSIVYDRQLEEHAKLGDGYEFRPMFKEIRSTLHRADLAIGSFGATVAPMYPSLTDLPKSIAKRHFVNAPKELLEGLKFAGFDALACAHPFNLDAGVPGLRATGKNIDQSGLVSAGIGIAKTPIFEVNNLKIAIVSYTLDSYDTRNSITHEGAAVLLNRFDPAAAKKEIYELRDAGVHFVLGYLDTRSSTGKYRYTERMRSAKELAEAGADYVVCTAPNVLSKLVRYTTEDSRNVSIASSLGTFFGGETTGPGNNSALLKIVVRSTGEGTLEVEDSYIPLQRLEFFGGTAFPVVPTLGFFNSKVETTDFEEGHLKVSESLGPAISSDMSRKVWMSTHNVAQLSPLEIAEILGLTFSQDHEALLGGAESKKLNNIVTRKGDLRSGCAAVIGMTDFLSSSEGVITEADAIAAGATIAISRDLHEGIPTLQVKSPFEAHQLLMRAIVGRHDPLTVAITGTVGKTTTMQLMSEVFDRHFRTLHIEGNNNTLHTASTVLQKLTNADQAYIQEVHGGTKGSASAVSRMIQPDICLITNIGEGHLNQMGSLENVIDGKLQIVDGMKDSGTLVLNKDNEHLVASKPAVSTVWYSVADSSADYYAKSIQSDAGNVSFVLAAPCGEYEVALGIDGIHNVSNAVGVFAASHVAGIPPHKITAGLASFRSASNRQNLVHAGGYKLLVDAFNSNLLSLQSALSALEKIELDGGARRVAVLADMGEQGTKVRENHEIAGRIISQVGTDLLLCVGEGMRFAAVVARSLGVDAYHYASTDELNRAIVQNIKPGDAVLFKGSGASNLTERVIRPLFGKIV